jgi:CxxC motif-containing protein
MAVKTERPIKKSEMFEIMEKIRKIESKPKKIGQVVMENISEDINLVSAQDMDI